MRPWAHTLPTDHIYFSHHRNAGSFAPVPVTAPAPGVMPGAHVDAGSRIGDSAGIAFDFAVLNAGVRLAFANPARYGPNMLQTDASLKDFEGPARGALYAKVRRVGIDLDGVPPGTDQLRLLLVQMLDAQRIHVEALPVRTGTTATFTANARTCLR